MDERKRSLWQWVADCLYRFRQPLQVGAILAAWFVGLPSLPLVALGFLYGTGVSTPVIVSVAAFTPLAILIYANWGRFRWSGSNLALEGDFAATTGCKAIMIATGKRMDTWVLNRKVVYPHPPPEGRSAGIAENAGRVETTYVCNLCGHRFTVLESG